ncbi:MAG: hypothetical protein ACLP51_18290 [Syntrophobacteraceae bacterium]
MKKYSSIIIIFLFLTVSAASCAALSGGQQRDYGLLKTAVTFSADKIMGEFGDRIPDNLDAEMFLRIVHGKIPDEFYKALTDHSLVVVPKGSYYLLKVYDKSTHALILFDYSCTPEADGRVLEEPGKFDVNHLELYDPCK